METWMKSNVISRNKNYTSLNNDFLVYHNRFSKTINQLPKISELIVFALFAHFL